MSVLVLSEHDNVVLKQPSLSAITAALQVGETPVHLLVAGAKCRAVADRAAEIKGVDKVLIADAPHYRHGLAEPMAELVATLAGDYGHVIAAATAFGKNILPRAAGLRGMAMVSDICAVVSVDTFVRPVYAGSAVEVTRAQDRLKFITVRAASFEAAPRHFQTVPIEPVVAAPDPGLSGFVDEEMLSSNRPQLGSARVVIAGGRGLGSKERFALLERLADKLGAAVGATRAAVDAGYAPNDFQIGQSGKVVAPDLYIAVGVSGATQHLAGMKDSKVIVAINNDAEAPIFQVADYGLVADLSQALPEFEAALDAIDDAKPSF